MELKWEPDFTIRVGVEGGTAVISANRDGLVSLANHFAALAEETPGTHIHLDEYNSLEKGSAGLIVQRTD